MRWILFAFCALSFALPAWAIPIITNPEPTSISDNSFAISWSTTNEASTTEILWGAGGLTNINTISATLSKYHYAELTGLLQNTTYQYRVLSRNSTGEAMVFPPAPPYFPLTYQPLSFKTLEKPSGEYLFSFAVINDLRFAPDKTSTKGAMGIPYEYCTQIISSEVNDINEKGVAFTVINGNIADQTVTYDTQIKNTLKNNHLERLTGASDLSSAAYKYVPTTGVHDKKATYTTAADDWLSDNLLPLTTNPGTTESRYTTLYGYDTTSRDVDSVFNYQFKYKYYNFIFLDSVKDNGTGSVDLAKLYQFLSAESNSKTFIFTSYPAYNLFNADGNGAKDYPVDIPTTEVAGGLYIDNHTAFRATLEAFKDAASNPIVAAVISGHLGDNYKRELGGISYVRQGPALQFPTGYSIYKVYSTGYVKTFYKTKGRDANDIPYYEYARDQISSEVAGGQTLGKDILTQFWLGSSSNRNFTYQYAFIPGVSPKVISTGPSSNESSVGLNCPILITFNKRMSESNLNEWVTIKDFHNNPVAVSNASFTDSSRLILKVTHPDFTANNTYEVTVNASKVMDEGSTTMAPDYPDYVFSFNTLGGTKDEKPPTAAIDPLPNNSTTDPFPNFTGIASDTARVIVVEYRFDNTGSWITTEAVHGKFTGTIEVFQIKPSAPLSVGFHQLWLRTYDGIGNTSLEGFSAYSFTIIVGEKPTTSSLKINGNTIYPGDPIDATPKIEVAITSQNSLESIRIKVGSLTPIFSLARVDNNYYITCEVGSSLSDGIHGITIEAFDVLGNATTYEVYPLYVRSAVAATIQGSPLSYPNPFDPGTQTTAISYTLSKSSAITLTIHDLSGAIIAKKEYAANADGGRAGYNEVTWDGKTDAGDYVGNGIYIYLIIADGKVISKGKLTVLKR